MKNVIALFVVISLVALSCTEVFNNVVVSDKDTMISVVNVKVIDSTKVYVTNWNTYNPPVINNQITVNVPDINLSNNIEIVNSPNININDTTVFNFTDGSDTVAVEIPGPAVVDTIFLPHKDCHFKYHRNHHKGCHN